MSINVTIPSPGESVTEVTLASWLKQDGDYVEKDEPLFEIESDKATLSVSAESAGTLHIKVPQGETVKVGTVAAIIDESVVGAGQVRATRPPEPETKPKPEPPKRQRNWRRLGSTLSARVI